MKSENGFIVPMILFGVLALLSGIGLIVYFQVYSFPKQTSLTPLPTPAVSAVVSSVVDFASCVEAGNPIQESYPRKCNANGKSFTEVVSSRTDETVGIYEHQGDYFKIVYPKNWIVDSFSTGADFFTDEVSKEKRDQVAQTFPFILPMIAVEVLNKQFSIPDEIELFVTKPQTITIGNKNGITYQKLCSPTCGINYDFPYAGGGKTISFVVFALDDENLNLLSLQEGISIRNISDEMVRKIITDSEFD